MPLDIAAAVQKKSRMKIPLKQRIHGASHGTPSSLLLQDRDGNSRGEKRNTLMPSLNKWRVLFFFAKS